MPTHRQKHENVNQHENAGKYFLAGVRLIGYVDLQNETHHARTTDEKRATSTQYLLWTRVQGVANRRG